MITDIKFECISCGQKMLVDAEAAGMHIDCPACGCSIAIPKVRAMNDRSYAPKAARKREEVRIPAGVAKGSQRHNGGDTTQFSDPEISDLRRELLDASVQTSELERELADALFEGERSDAALKNALAEVESRASANRKLQDELKRLSEEHQLLCQKYTAAASDRDTAVACTQQLADEVGQLRQRAEAAEALMDEAAGQIAALRAETVELTQAIAGAQEEISAYVRQVEKKDRDLADERERHVEAQSERTSAMRTNAALEEQLNGLRTELASTRASLVVAEENAAKLETTELTLAGTAEQLKASKERAASLENELSETSRECQSLRRSLSENTAGKDLMEVRDQLAEVSKERERLAAEVLLLSEDFKATTALKASGDEQIKDLTRELEEARRRAEAASEARLRQDNEVLRGIIARQNSELEQKHTQLTRLRRARFGVRLAYASFALGLVLVAAWAIKTVPGLQLSSFLRF